MHIAAHRSEGSWVLGVRGQRTEEVEEVGKVGRIGTVDLLIPHPLILPIAPIPSFPNTQHLPQAGTNIVVIVTQGAWGNSRYMMSSSGNGV